MDKRQSGEGPAHCRSTILANKIFIFISIIVLLEKLMILELI